MPWVVMLIHLDGYRTTKPQSPLTQSGYILIVPLVPLYVITMVAVHVYARTDERAFSLIALVFMVVLAGYYDPRSFRRSNRWPSIGSDRIDIGSVGYLLRVAVDNS